MIYEFPENWVTGLKSDLDLAVRLGMGLKDLKKLESRIPKHYRTRQIIQKGKTRTLSVPDKKLKSVQKVILSNILNFDFPKYVHGGIAGSSIISNAKTHRNKKWVACLDIHHFFPSVHDQKVKDVFLALGCEIKVAEILTHFTTYNHELPQGSPTSPIISNLVLYPLDKRVSNLCNTKKFRYSRYFDDITVSGNRNLNSTCDKIIDISRTIGFRIHKNPKKFRIMPDTQNQIVTGLIVNKTQLEVDPTFFKNLEDIIENFAIKKTIDQDLNTLISKTKGMLAFLASVDREKANDLSKKFKSIDWSFYGLE